MRSYKDCLLEYVEERSFSELSISWFHYLLNSLDSTPKTFQILESFPPIRNSLELSRFADGTPSECLVNQFSEMSSKKRSDVYKSLIKELVIIEIKKIQSQNSSLKINLKLLEGLLQPPKTKKYSSYAKQFKSCLSDAGADKEIIKKYFDQMNTSPFNSFNAIEKFYDADNYYLNIPKYGIQSTTSTIGTLAVNFDSHCFYQSAENEWTQQTVNPHSAFIKGDDPSLFFSINSKAKVSPIKVSGELRDIEKTELKPGNWFDEKLIHQLFESEHKSFDGKLDPSFQQQVKKELQKRAQTFYSFQQYDLTIEVQNVFTDEEIELLRNNSFSVFPFHLSAEHASYKWIDRNEDGNLRIKIKSKSAQRTIFGAELEMIKV